MDRRGPDGYDKPRTFGASLGASGIGVAAFSAAATSGIGVAAPSRISCGSQINLPASACSVICCDDTVGIILPGCSKPGGGRAGGGGGERLVDDCEPPARDP